MIYKILWMKSGWSTHLKVQIERLMKRNNLDLDQAKARVHSQISIDKKAEWLIML